MTTEFQKISELERSKKITVGVVKNHANNFWSNTTLIGKILNWLTPLLVIFSIFIFIKFGFMHGILSIIGVFIYVHVIQKIATMYVRVALLKNEKLFDAAYEARSTTIRNNSTGEVFSYPTDWKIEITNL